LINNEEDTWDAWRQYLDGLNKDHRFRIEKYQALECVHPDVPVVLLYQYLYTASDSSAFKTLSRALLKMAAYLFLFSRSLLRVAFVSGRFFLVGFFF
jgi:hypothetical protein